jgi:PPP family 3-phenylpropionic acid transporter
VLSLFLGAVHWASHVPYNLFLVFLCEERGFGGWLPGVSLAVGVVGEVIALAYATSISRRLRPEWILVAAVGVASLRWTLTAWLTVAWLLCALQFLHGITFGLFLICVMSILDREVPLALRASGQALLYLVVFAMGSAMGNLLTGILLDHTKPSQMFAVWGGIEALLVVPCLLMALRQKGPAKEEL